MTTYEKNITINVPEGVTEVNLGINMAIGQAQSGGGGGAATATFVDAFTEQVNGDPTRNFNIGAASGASTRTLSDTIALTAGRHVFTAVAYDLDSNGGLVVEVTGQTVTQIASVSSNDIGHAVYVCDIPSDGDYVVGVRPEGESCINKAVAIYKVNDDADVTFTAALPIDATSDPVLGFTTVINQDSPYTPDGGSDLTVHATGDLRSGERVWFAQWNGPASDITADSAYTGGTSDFALGFALISKP